MPDRYIAKLDNYYLDIISIRDDIEYSLAVNEYPYSDYNEIEHLGRKPRKIQVECSFQNNPAKTEGWSASGEIVEPWNWKTDLP